MKPKVLLFLLLIITSFPVFSQIGYTWVGEGANNDWGNSLNWKDQSDLNGVPTNMDTAIFNTGTVINVDNVPNSLTLAGLTIHPFNDTGVGTTVNFSFTAGAGEVFLNELVITEECSLNYSEDKRIIVNSTAYFNQGSLGIPAGSIYFYGETNIDFHAIFLADSVVNYYIMSLFQETDLELNCIFDNQDIFNINDGSVIVHNKFFNSNIMNGDINAYFELASDAIYCDPLPAMQLGTLVNNSDLSFRMAGDLIIENILDLRAGNLRINNYLLTINGDCKFGSGSLDGTIDSRLEVNNGAYATANGIDTIYLYFTGVTDTLQTFSLNKTNGLVHFTTNMVIANSLNLNSGKIRFKHNSLELFETTTYNCNKDNYVITDTASYILVNIASGSQITFPVGTNRYYAPVTIVPESDAIFYVSVADHAYSHGSYGIPLSPRENVDLTWKVESDNTSTNYTVDFNWDPAAQGPDFILAEASTFHHDGTQWSRLTNISVADVSVLITGVNYQSVTDGIDFGYFAVTSQFNEAPIAGDTEFTISEDIESGTLIGTIDISDPDTDQMLFIFPDTHDYGRAFYFEHGGGIYVDSSELLHYPTLPVYYYNIAICDNGLPIRCIPILVTINLERGNRDFFVTNYISPNNDGYNDRWIIMEADRVNFEVFIYNNSGDIVYKSDNYRNEWDGTSNGSKLAPGVYFFLIRSLYGDQRGTVTIAR